MATAALTVATIAFFEVYGMWTFCQDMHRATRRWRRSRR